MRLRIFMGHTYIISIGILVIYGAVLHASTDTSLFKESYNVLAPLYQHLSPLHGLTAWEHKIPENYYVFSTLEPKTEASWLPAGDGPSRLSHALFAKEDGSIHPSTHKHFPAAHLGITTLASIVGLLEKQRHGNTLAPDILEHAIVTDQSFIASLLPAITQPTLQDLLKANLETNRLFYEKKRALKLSYMEERLTTLQKLTGKDLSAAQKEISQLSRTKRELLKTVIPHGDYNRVRELACAIIDTEHASPTTHPPLSARTLLLAFLATKIKSPADCPRFLHQLQETLATPIFKPVAPEKPLAVMPADNHDLSHIQENLQEAIAQLPKTGTRTLSDMFEQATYLATLQTCHHGNVPPLAPFACVSYKGYVYGDCVESTLHNWYSSIAHQDGAYQPLAPLQSKETYQTWADRFVHQPLISYRACITQDTKGKQQVRLAPDDTLGFIFGLPKPLLDQCPRDGERVSIGGHWYIPVNPNDCTLCEMLPSTRNCIISMDRLCNLHLFDNLEGDFFSPTFNATHLPQLLKRLPQLGTPQFTTSQLAQFDQYDCSTTELHIPFTDYMLSCYRRHAELTPRGVHFVDPDIGAAIANTITAPDQQNNSDLIQALIAFPTHFEHLLHALGMPAFYVADLRTPELKLATLQYLLKSPLPDSQDQATRDAVQQKIKQLIEALPINLDWKYQIDIIEASKEDHLKTFLAPTIKKWLDIVGERLQHPDVDDESILVLMSHLVDRGLALDAAEALANQYIDTQDPATQEAVQKVFTALAKQGYAHA